MPLLEGGAVVNERIVQEQVKKNGIVLVNLGSPAAPDTRSVRKYLHQFLTDRRIIALNPLLWLPILHGVILRTRPKKSAALYQKIWGKRPDGSFEPEAPLVRIGRAQVKGVEAALDGKTPVEIAMRYGSPSIDTALGRLAAQGCTDIGVLPLFPQYAGATTESVMDELKRFKRNNGDVRLSMLRDYCDHPAYIKLIADSVRGHIDGLEWEPTDILFSFHGLPKTSIEKGDPYEGECRQTFECVRASLPDLSAKMQITFQSRFGPKKWIEPYTLTTLTEMKKGAKTVIVTPGFPADSLETLEELGIEARREFLGGCGEAYSLIPCLNEEKPHVKMLADLAQEYLLNETGVISDETGIIRLVSVR